MKIEFKAWRFVICLNLMIVFSYLLFNVNTFEKILLVNFVAFFISFCGSFDFNYKILWRDE